MQDLVLRTVHAADRNAKIWEPAVRPVGSATPTKASAACENVPQVVGEHPACYAGSQRYDAGMTRSKIAISLPKAQPAMVHREIRAGRAESVSGYIARVLAEHEKRESLRALLRDLIEQYGEPATKDIKWAERALAPRRG
jgi:hypothetical protein